MRDAAESSEPKQICTYCGRENDMASSQCRECGTELIRAVRPATYSPAPPEPIEPEPSPPAMPPAPLAPRRTASHPVADNPIRMLAGDGWNTPRDLVKNARRLKLMSRDGAIDTKEPGLSFCPRLRSQEDFLAAEKQATDPVEFAVALAFLPDHWMRPDTEIGQANLLLLEAEQFPQGHGKKADLVNRAIRSWDGEAGGKAIEAAALESSRHFGTSVDATAVQHRVGSALCSIAEQVLADFGDSIEVSELELLNTLDKCQRMPEPRGAVAAGDNVILKQQERIDRFLIEGNEIARSGKLTKQGFISESEVDRLVEVCREAKAALTLLQHRPALLHRVPEDRPMHLSTLSSGLAFQLGWNYEKWGQAAELIRGAKSENLDPTLEPWTRRLFEVAIPAIPIMANIARGQNLLQQIEALNITFPHYPTEVQAFQLRAQEILSRIPGSGVSAPVTASESSGGIGFPIGFALFAALSLLRTCSTADRRQIDRPYGRPEPVRRYESPRVPVRLLSPHSPATFDLRFDIPH